MGRKGKKNHHTAKELQRKIDAHKPKGGGKAGIAKRKQVKLDYSCDICMTKMPSLKNLKEHFGNKHPKHTFNSAKWEAAEAEAKSGGGAGGGAGAGGKSSKGSKGSKGKK